MPHACLIKTDWEPGKGPWLARPQLPADSAWHFWSWEAFVELPQFKNLKRQEGRRFTSVTVYEGFSGLHVTPTEASKRGLEKGSRVPCYIATYKSAPDVRGGVEPKFRFWVDLEVHVWDIGAADDDHGPSCFVGGADFFLHFDIDLGSNGIIQANARGHLEPVDKRRIEDSHVLLTKKPSVTRPCLTL